MLIMTVSQMVKEWRRWDDDDDDDGGDNGGDDDENNEAKSN